MTIFAFHSEFGPYLASGAYILPQFQTNSKSDYPKKREKATPDRVFAFSSSSPADQPISHGLILSLE